MKLGLFGLLTIIFVICKIAGIIDWSWWLVFLPMYGGALLGLFVLVTTLLLAAWSSK